MPPLVTLDGPHDDLSRRRFLTVLKGLDLTGIESAGEVYGEVNVEKLVALDIDLVVTAFDPRQNGPIFGFVEGPVQGQVERTAPIVAINAIEDLGGVIRRFEDLAASLGADAQAPEMVTARERFENAHADLRAAAAAKPDLLAFTLSAEHRGDRGDRRRRPRRQPQPRLKEDP